MIHVQRALVLFLFFPVLALAAAPLGFDDARHLLNRTSFAASIDDINAFSRLTRAQAVDQLLASTANNTVATLAPAWSNNFESPRRLRGMSAEERKVAQREQFEKGAELRGWWMQEMLVTQTPLTEKMVLFWHNHFVSSLQKVRSPVLMYRQHLVLRKHALGYFGDLLHDVSKDAAMVIYLDNASNRKAQPNENFAREVMELFTLGEGRYGERDVKEAARAFTGLSVDRETLDYRYRPFFHDGGAKTVFGKTGRFTAPQVLDLILARPEAAEFVAAKLWKELVSPTPERAELARAAAAFRDARYEVRPLVRALLLSDTFWAKDNRGSLIRSPVDLVVGTMRTFDIRPPSLRPAAFASALLGQNLLAPPNVKGWPGGEEWINSTTLLGRKQFVERLFRSDDRSAQMLARPMQADGTPDGMSTKASPPPRQRGMNAQRQMERGLAAYAVNADGWASVKSEDPQRLLLPIAAVNPPAEGLAPGDLVRHLVADSAYQLK